MAINQIAKASGVSISTVSRVLNNDTGVSDELRLKTLEVIERCGYKPRSNIKRCVRIAVVVSSDCTSFESFFACLYSGISLYASAHGIDTTLIHFKSTPTSSKQKRSRQSLAKALRLRRCNGVILLSSLEHEIPELVEANIPVMLVANRHEMNGVGYIDCNNFSGALELTRYLISLGHKKIGFLCNVMTGNEDHRERLTAYRQALASRNLLCDEDWIIPHSATDVSEKAGYNQAKLLLQKHPEITAIFATNDSMAFGAICACVEMGKRVPEDISVVGYDDNPTSRYYTPSLTTVRQPLRDMGYDAARYIHEKLSGKIASLPTKILENELIVRRSCSPLTST